MNPKPIIAAGMVLLLGVGMAWARQRTHSDEGGHILALDNSWNRALETKDTKALDLLLASFPSTSMAAWKRSVNSWRASKRPTTTPRRR
jgi:hypothetical protein